MVEFARRNQPRPHLARHGRGESSRGCSTGCVPSSSRWSCCPAVSGSKLRAGRRAARRSASGASSRPARRSTCSSSAAARRAGGGRLRRLGGARHARRWRARRWAVRPGPRAGSRTTSASRPGSAGRSSPAAPPRRHGSSARGRRRRTVPSRSSPGWRAARRPARRRARGRGAHGASSPPAPTIGGSTCRTSPTTRARASSTRRARRRRVLCGGTRVGVVGGGNSAGQAAVWLARGGALVTLLHRRGDLRETMSSYLRRRARPLRDRGARPQRARRTARRARSSRGVTLKDGTRLPLKFAVHVSRRGAVHGLAGGHRQRDEHGFVVTGERSVCSRRASPACSPSATSARGR